MTDALWQNGFIVFNFDAITHQYINCQMYFNIIQRHNSTVVILLNSFQPIKCNNKEKKNGNLENINTQTIFKI